jgi:hypothetical protein
VTRSAFDAFCHMDAVIEIDVVGQVVNAGPLNYYRLEAGRFEGFVSYGLKSFAHELT